MGKILAYPVSKFPIGIETVLCAVGMFHPGTDMALIYGHGGFERISVLTLGHPLFIRPADLLYIICYRCGAGAKLCEISKRIGLVDTLTICCSYEIFVKLTLTKSRNKTGIDTTVTHLRHRVCRCIPIIEISYDMDLSGMWSPYTKENTFLSVLCAGMRTQLFINIIVRTLSENILIRF